jgi:hypothetical protein
MRCTRSPLAIVSIRGCEIWHAAVDKTVHAGAQAGAIPELGELQLQVVQQCMARERIGGRNQALVDGVVQEFVHVGWASGRKAVNASSLAATHAAVAAPICRAKVARLV